MARKIARCAGFDVADFDTNELRMKAGDRDRLNPGRIRAMADKITDKTVSREELMRDDEEEAGAAS